MNLKKETDSQLKRAENIAYEMTRDIETVGLDIRDLSDILDAATCDSDGTISDARLKALKLLQHSVSNYKVALVLVEKEMGW
jgi:hypothetical protein